MKKVKGLLSLLLCACFLVGTASISAYAATYPWDKTVNDGETFTDDNFGMMPLYNSNITFINNGTVNITNGFALYNVGDYGSSFTNNKTFISTGNFTVMAGCTFTNAGTATISDVSMFCINGVFRNTGIFFISGVEQRSSLSAGDFENSGTIVYGDDIQPSLITEFKERTTDSGRVISKYEYENEKPKTNKITYDLNGGSWKTDPDEAIYSYAVDGTEYYSFGWSDPYKVSNNVTREHYKFIGWTCDKISEYATTPAKGFWFKSDIGDFTVTAHWEVATHNVYYNLDGGSFNESTDVIKKDANNNIYSEFNEFEEFTLPTPSKPGYTFVGWAKSTELNASTTVTIPVNTTTNLLYIAKWTANGDTKYTLNAYYMDEEGNYSADADITKELTGETDAVIDYSQALPTEFTKNGFTYDADKSVSSGTISADGSLEIKLYYKRNQYDISFMNEDGTETLYSYKGYYGAPIKYVGSTPTLTLDEYDCTFEGWTGDQSDKKALSDLGNVSGDKTFYAVFKKEARFCLVTLSDIEGFVKPESMTTRVEKGGEYKIQLSLESEKYCLGTKDWGFPFVSALRVGFTDSTGFLDKSKGDFTITCEGYGKPVVLTIPNVTNDLTIIFKPQYHEEHMCAHSKDIIKRPATCTETGIVTHTCYKCGKTLDSVIDMLSHTPDDVNKFISDENSHWNTCKCGKVLNKAEHTFEWIIDKKATDAEKGSKHEECKICGYKKVGVEIPATGTPEPAINYGDVNRDGEINLLDVWVMRKHIVGWDNEIDLEAADCYTDGKINSKDVLLLRKFIAKWNVTLGPHTASETH